MKVIIRFLDIIFITIKILTGLFMCKITIQFFSHSCSILTNLFICFCCFIILLYIIKIQEWFKQYKKEKGV